jgi:peptidyl-prolyl cis-trans isomerase SurA
MKKLFILLTFIACTAFTVVSFAHEESLDKTVAVVNDDIITQSELDAAIASAKMQIASEQIAAPSDSVLHKQVLDQLINKKLQLQAAHQAGLDVNATELETAITTIATRNHLTTAQLYKKMSEEGMNVADYRTELHDELLIQKLQQQEVAGKIAVTPQEITAFIHSSMFQANATREYRLEDILIPTGDDPSPATLNTAKTKAMTVLKSVRNGVDFKKVALAESGDSHALQGGDLGWRPLAEIPTAFASKVLTMNKNDVIGPIQTPNGFHIIRLADVRSDGAAGNVPDRKTVENMLLQQKFEQAVQNWVMKLRSQAFITLNDFHFSHQA